MTILAIIGVISGACTLIPAVLSQIGLWQRKEYRWDRMRAHLTTPAGSISKERYVLLGIFLTGVSWIGYIFSPMAAWIEVVSLAAIIAFGAHHVLRIRRIGVVRPQFTLKSITVLGIVVVLIAIYFFTLFTPFEVPVLQIATLNFLLPAVVATSIPITNIIFYIQKQKIVRQATEYRKQLKDITVVGITGSYGKTSTKHFLQHILAGTEKKVAVTAEHCNSYFCVAQDLLRQVESDTDIYVAEMGAYRKGEIKEITDIVHPRVGVITIIGNQHLDLFGSQKNILEAKWELAQSLPQEGTVVINADDTLLTEKAATFSGKRVGFSTTQEADVYLSDVRVNPKDVSVTLHLRGESHSVTIPLASPALLSSLLAAVSAADALGIDPAIIVKQIKTVKPFARTMEIKSGVHNSTVIDDSYSAGEVPVKNAIEHLKVFTSSDKRIVFVPIIELGADGSRVHREIGELLASSDARVYVYGEEYKKELSISKSKNIRWYTNPDLLTADVLRGVGSDTTILLEGRIPSITRTQVVKST